MTLIDFIIQNLSAADAAMHHLQGMEGMEFVTKTQNEEERESYL